MPNRDNSIDFFDVASGGACIMFIATSPTLFAALPVGLAWLGVRTFRRTTMWESWMDRISSSHKIPGLASATKLLLPPPADDDTIIQTQPIDVNVVNTERLSWAQKISKQPEYERKQVLTTTKQVSTTLQNTQKILARMPKYISYEKIPDPPTKTSVLLGYDPVAKNWVWSDFDQRGDTIHALIAGQTGTGKDSILRLWYTMLTSNNTPEEIKFIFIDGKGEWMSEALAQSPHMLYKPAGGFDPYIDDKGKLRDRADEELESALINAFKEIKRRSDELTRVGAINADSYFSKTGTKLPLLFIVATDVGTNLEGNIETLVKMMTFKGRSLNIRMIISMQSASGENTGWRGQLSLAMSGFQQIPQADAPNMGVPIRSLLYRPSELPAPEPNDLATLGLFIMRKGNTQALLKTVHLPDTVFEAYCENQVLAIEQKQESFDLFEQLLQTTKIPEKKPIIVKKVLTPDEARAVAFWAKKGLNKTEIMINKLHFTNGDKYKEASPHVQAIIDVVKRGRV